MNAQTPGQQACIAWNEHYAEEHGIEARNEWAASDSRGRDAWEAAAKAAIDWQRGEDATPTAEDYDHAADVISGRVKTAGQQAYEACWQYGADEFGADIDDAAPSIERWETLPKWQQCAWEAAAAAVETDQLRSARADRAAVRKAMLDLADELEDETAGDGSWAAQATARAAAKIRKALDI